MAEPRLMVLSALFPSLARPNAGVFIRERMFRVGRYIPLVVISPQPWFPGQGLIRLLHPGYRPTAPRHEKQQGIDVYRPRFLAIPGALRWLDGLSMAIGSYFTVRRLKRRHDIRLIDAHFAHPDGEAAAHLGRWLNLPVTVTLRGTEVPHSRNPRLAPRIAQTLLCASRIFTVSDSLRQLALRHGVASEKTEVVGNGVDLERFHPEDKHVARQKLGLPDVAKVLVSVGALVERKGMHRVIACLPTLLETHSELHYLIVGGASPEGDMRDSLERQVNELGLAGRVHFLGALPPDELRWPLSAADVFVLATANEGWANVFLEAMACGLPVVTTAVGGNAEVVCRDELGSIVPFGDATALRSALADALTRDWDRQGIRAHAEANAWDGRVAVLVREFQRLMAEPALSASCIGNIARLKP